MNVEFEYVLTNGDIDVDKIIAQRKRKRLVSVKCSSFEELGKYKAAEHQNKTYQTKLMVCSNPEDPEVWYLSLIHILPFVAPQPKVQKETDDIKNLLSVEVQSPELCPRYVARMVKNVKIGPSPRWMRAVSYTHLEPTTGLRSA